MDDSHRDLTERANAFAVWVDEFFGHAKGAFTGAARARVGLFRSSWVVDAAVRGLMAIDRLSRAEPADGAVR